jgi:integrase
VREKMPKTAAGGRRIPFDAFLADELRSHRARQAEEQLQLGKRLTADDYIVAQVDGSPLKPNSLSHEFRRWLRSTPLPFRVRFHDLRHSHASQMLTSDIHPKIVQERLGHTSIRTTLDLYSHVMPGLQEAAADKVGAALAAAIAKQRSRARD